MADEIQDADVRVTPSFHPQTIQSLDVYDDDTSSILAGTVSAFTEAYIAVGRVHDASAASKTNPAWNEAAALIHTADFADKLTLLLAKRFDSATAGLTRVIEGLESELSQPIEGQGVGAMAGEIRAFVRGMSDGERMGFIRKAIEAGDTRTVGACLGGPAYLSGLTPEMQTALLRVLWRGDLDEKFPSIRMRTDRRGFQVVPALIDAGKRYSQV